MVFVSGCATPGHRLAPTTLLVGVREDGVRARVVELVPPDAYRAGHVVVEVQNPTPRPLTIARGRLAFVGLSQPRTPNQRAWSGDTGGGGIIGVSGSGLSGGSSGSSSSSPGGSSSGAWGGGLGGGLGFAVGLVLLAPLMIPSVVDLGKLASLDAEPPEQIAAGASARLDVEITPPLADVAQHLTLGTALDDGRSPLHVPVIDPSVAHGGWRPDRRVEHLVLRLGGGPIMGDGHYSGTGGIEALAGGAIGPVHIRVSGAAGVGLASGLEVATTHDIGGLEIAPSIAGQVGFAFLGKTKYASPTFGLDLTLPVERKDLLGWRLVGQRMGLYGKVGPVWTEDGRFMRWEAGVSIR
jgi:hypothetical protein